MPDEFDESALMDRVDQDLEFLEETVEMLEEDAPTLLDAIHQAATARDAEALVKPAHALKGMLANFCAGPAEAAARELEVRGREHRLDDVDAAVQVLQGRTEQLRTALQAFVQAHKA